MDNTGYPFPIDSQATDLANEEYVEDDSSSTLSCPATSSSSTSETPSPPSSIFSTKSDHHHHHLPTDQCSTLIHNVDSIYSSPTSSWHSQQKLKKGLTSYPPGSQEINLEEVQEGEEERKGGGYDMEDETEVQRKSRLKFASTTPGEFILPFQSLHEKKMNLVDQ